MPHPKPVVERVLLVGDPFGLPALLDAFPRQRIVGLVGASLRPQQHEALRKLAATADLPLLIQPGARAPGFPAFLAAVEALQPELIVVHSYAMRLPDAMLRLARYGGVNLHGALLPRYRGASPLQAALMNGERVTGVTMHAMTTGFDEGPVITQRCVPLQFTDTWHDAWLRIMAAARDLIQEEAPSLLAQTHRLVPQDESLAGYCPRRSPADGLFHWDAPVITIYHLVRALVAPHPGAFFRQNGHLVVLDRYMPPAAIAALKFGSWGGRTVTGDQLQLLLTAVPPAVVESDYAPVPPRPSERLWRVAPHPLTGGAGLNFTVIERSTGARLGTAAIAEPDWMAGTAVARLALRSSAPRDEAEALVRRFCKEEFQLALTLPSSSAGDGAELPFACAEWRHVPYK